MPTPLPSRSERRRTAEAWEIEVDERGCVPGLDFFLFDQDGRLSIARLDAPRDGSLCVDFSTIEVRRGGAAHSGQQPLIKACGPRPARVFDATAGLGHDSILLASFGYDVIAAERSPVLAALLTDGLDRLRQDPDRAPFADRVDLRRGESATILRELETPPDVVYFDPMYPPKRKRSALARKSVRWIRELVGTDEDAEETYAAARECATRRVVVKRPHHAPPLGGEPTYSNRGKLVRYDVTIIHP